MTSKLNTLLRNVLFTILIVFAFFVCLELLARGVIGIFPSMRPEQIMLPTLQDGPIVSDNILNHKWVASLRTSISERGIKYDFFTNAQSWVENYDIQIEKDPNVHRIFYVGDSNVQGVVPYGKNMVELVEKQLNDIYAVRGTRIEVINTGTSSYSTILYYLLIKEQILKYSPDLVIINVDMSDVPNDLVYRKRLIADARGNPLAVPPFQLAEKERYIMTPHGMLELSFLHQWQLVLYKHLVFYQLMSELLKRATGTVFNNEHMLLYAQRWLTWHNRSADNSADWLRHEWTDMIRKNVAHSMNVLGKTIDLLRMNGVKVAVTGVPWYPQYTGFWSAKPHTILSNTAKKHGIPYLNSYEALKEVILGTPVTEYYWKSDPTHFNEKGNQCWARVHLEFLLKNREKLLLH